MKNKKGSVGIIAMAILFIILLVTLLGFVYAIYKEGESTKEVNINKISEQNELKNSESQSNLPKESLTSEVENKQDEDAKTIAEIDNICSKHDELMASFCYAEAASDMNSTNICEKIKGDPEEMEYDESRCKDMVNTKLATENKNFQYCLNLSNNTDCIREVASITGESSFCSQVKYKQYVSVCQKEAAAAKAINEAIGKGDKTICENISFYQDRGDCFERLGISLNDSSLCELAQSEEDTAGFYRANCYLELAIKNTNLDYCEKIMDFGNWGESCLDDVNTVKGYLTQCLQKGGTDESSCLSMAVQVFNETNDVSTGDTDYSPVALKNFYNRAKNKCTKWSSNEAVENECERILDEIYKSESEYI